MRLKELLFEYVNLDTSIYGAWIDTKRLTDEYIIPVEGREDHAPIMKTVIDHLRSEKKIYDNVTKYNALYNWGFNNGFVRVVYEPDVISLQGNIEDIKKAWMSICVAVLKSFNVVIISPTKGKDREFSIPQDKNQLTSFLMGQPITESNFTPLKWF